MYILKADLYFICGNNKYYIQYDIRKRKTRFRPMLKYCIFNFICKTHRSQLHLYGVPFKIFSVISCIFFLFSCHNNLFYKTSKQPQQNKIFITSKR